MLRVLVALVVLVVGGLVFACGGDDDATGAPTQTVAPGASSATPTTKPAASRASPTIAPSVGGHTTVAVTLSEYSVVIDADSGSAGSFKFSINNTGPNEGHVFMIVQTDLPPDALPTTSTGQFAPSADAVILANTPGINPSATDSFSYDLEAGKYVFICNNVDPQGKGHYGLGMHTAFTVQ